MKGVYYSLLGMQGGYYSLLGMQGLLLLTPGYARVAATHSWVCKGCCYSLLGIQGFLLLTWKGVDDNNMNIFCTGTHGWQTNTWLAHIPGAKRGQRN